ncbi:MAG: glycosyltransferase family 2 protein [Nodosilinea sp.]
MANHTPRLVIGMPVYNGGKHISETIESILNQSFADFRLLISDNASTDNTEDVCRHYAESDPRVVYHRQAHNLGMAPNFNYVFRPEGSPYFKWAAHDDILKPDYLQHCIDLLDKDASLALAHCPTLRIDDNSHELGTYRDLGLQGDRIRERFWRIMWTINIYEIYAVMRSDYVAKTKLAGSYFGSERNILADLLLQGNIGYLDEALFARRDHEGSLTAMHLESKEKNDFAKRQEVHAPKAKMSEIQTSAIRFKEYFLSLWRFPMPLDERLACLGALLDWGTKRALEGVTKSGEKYRQQLYAQHVNQEA